MNNSEEPRRQKVSFSTKDEQRIVESQEAEQAEQAHDPVCSNAVMLLDVIHNGHFIYFLAERSKFSSISRLDLIARNKTEIVYT